MQNPGKSQAIGLNLELFHVQTETSFELLPNLNVIRLGKPKNQVLGDINVSGLPNVNFVSRLHAEIQKEENTYYIVDVGSSNGTYLNNIKLEPKKRYPLNLGDKIDLSQAGKVTFLFLNKQKVVPEPTTSLNNVATVLQLQFLETNSKQTLIEHLIEYLRKLLGIVEYLLNYISRSLKKLLKK